VKRAETKLWSQLDRLDPDDALVPDYQLRLRQNKERQADLTADLARAEAQAAEVEQRQATLRAFGTYAAEQRDNLDDKTPIEKRNILLALRTRCRLEPGDRLGRLAVRFDIRHLPGAQAALYLPGPDDTGPEDLETSWADIPSVEIVEDDEVAALLDELDSATNGRATLAASDVADTPGGLVVDARSRP
jgi:hypothetical protein